jgi:hypothetical protein
MRRPRLRRQFASTETVSFRSQDFFSPTSLAGHEKNVPLKISVDSWLNGKKIGWRLSHHAHVGYASWIHATCTYIVI